MSHRLGFVQIGVSLAALGAAIWWALRQHAPQLPGSTRAIGWISIAVALYAAGTALRTERWRGLLHLSEIKTSRGDAYGLVTVGYMGNNLLPARAGEVLRVFLLSRQAGGHGRKITGTVIAERILDAAELALSLAVVLYVVLSPRARPTNRPVLFVAVAVAVFIAAAIALRFARRRGVLPRAREFARPLADAPKALISARELPLLAMTVGIWALEAGVFAASACALAFNLSAVQAVYLVGLANLFTALPAAPGSIGTFEAAVVFGLSAISIGARSLSYLLLLRLVLYGPITVVGLTVLFVRYGGWKLVRERGRSPESATQPPATELPAATRG
jgi:glycosyltransferase 2 family protein